MTDNSLTYSEIETRCKEAAKELTPSLPTENTIEAWEAFEQELEDFDTNQVWEHVEGWDWSIYTNFGWKILHTVPQSRIDDAESQWLEFNHGMEVQDIAGGFDIWTIQSSIAFHVLIAWVGEEIQSLIVELQEVADMAIQNLGES